MAHQIARVVYEYIALDTRQCQQEAPSNLIELEATSAAETRQHIASHLIDCLRNLRADWYQQTHSVSGYNEAESGRGAELCQACSRLLAILLCGQSPTHSSSEHLMTALLETLCCICRHSDMQHLFLSSWDAPVPLLPTIIQALHGTVPNGMKLDTIVGLRFLVMISNGQTLRLPTADYPSLATFLLPTLHDAAAQYSNSKPCQHLETLLPTLQILAQALRTSSSFRNYVQNAAMVNYDCLRSDLLSLISSMQRHRSGTHVVLTSLDALTHLTLADAPSQARLFVRKNVEQMTRLVFDCILQPLQTSPSSSSSPFKSTLTASTHSSISKHGFSPPSARKPRSSASTRSAPPAPPLEQKAELARQAVGVLGGILDSELIMQYINEREGALSRFIQESMRLLEMRTESKLGLDDEARSELEADRLRAAQYEALLQALRLVYRDSGRRVILQTLTEAAMHKMLKLCLSSYLPTANYGIELLTSLLADIQEPGISSPHHPLLSTLRHALHCSKPSCGQHIHEVAHGRHISKLTSEPVKLEGPPELQHLEVEAREGRVRLDRKARKGKDVLGGLMRKVHELAEELEINDPDDPLQSFSTLSQYSDKRRDPHILLTVCRLSPLVRLLSLLASYPSLAPLVTTYLPDPRPLALGILAVSQMGRCASEQRWKRGKLGTEEVRIVIASLLVLLRPMDQKEDGDAAKQEMPPPEEDRGLKLSGQWARWTSALLRATLVLEIVCAAAWEEMDREICEQALDLVCIIRKRGSTEWEGLVQCMMQQRLEEQMLGLQRQRDTLEDRLRAEEAERELLVQRHRDFVDSLRKETDTRIEVFRVEKEQRDVELQKMTVDREEQKARSEAHLQRAGEGMEREIQGRKEAEGSLAALQKKMTEMSTGVERMQQEAASCDVLVRSSQEEVEGLREALLDKNDQRLEAEYNLKEALRSKALVEARYEEEHTQLLALARAFKVKEENVDRLMVSLREKERQVTQLSEQDADSRGRLCSRNAEVARLQDALEQRDLEVGKLKGKLAGENEQIQSINKALAAKDEDVTKLSSDFGQLKKVLMQKEEKLEEALEELRRHREVAVLINQLTREQTTVQHVDGRAE